MAGYNKVIMVGNLTRDPELRPVGSSSVCKLNIASNRQYKNRNTGALTQEVCFIDVEVWGAQADTCKLYLQKGKSILVEGRLKLDSWKDAEGNTKSKHAISAERIIFLGSGAGAQDSASNNSDSLSVDDDSYDNNFKDSIKAARGFGNNKKKSSNSFSDEESVNFDNNSPFKEEDLPF